MTVDMAAVVRVAPDRTPEYVIGGMQSIRYQIGREARDRRPGILASAFGLIEVGLFAAEPPQGGGKKALAALVAQGRDLFFNGTFGGNGRTCGTCHQATRDLTIEISTQSRACRRPTPCSWRSSIRISRISTRRIQPGLRWKMPGRPGSCEHAP